MKCIKNTNINNFTIGRNVRVICRKHNRIISRDIHFILSVRKARVISRAKNGSRFARKTDEWRDLDNMHI